MRESFQKARTLLNLSQVSATKLLISRYIHRVNVFPDKLEIQFNLDVPTQVIDMSLIDGRHEQTSHADTSLRLPKKHGRPQKIVILENHNKSTGSVSPTSESPNFVGISSNSGQKKKPQNGLLASSAVDSLMHHLLWCCAGGEGHPRHKSTEVKLLGLVTANVWRSKLLRYKYQHMAMLKTIIPTLEKFLLS